MPEGSICFIKQNQITFSFK